MIHAIVILVVMVVLMPHLTAAATWRVERDGTGDFVVLQDAVDAAESGDTILIGPGRYPETTEFDYFYGRTLPCSIRLEKSLTIVGAGKDATFIEPEPEGRNQFGTYGLASISSGLTLSISDLSFVDCDGMAVLFYMDAAGELDVHDVETQNCWTGVSVAGLDNGSVDSCAFRGILSGGRGVLVFDPIHSLSVTDCVFEGGYGGVDIHGANSQDISVQQCQFTGNSVGVAVFDAARVAIEQCSFLSNHNRGIGAERAVDLRIIDNTIEEEEGPGITLARCTGLVVTNNIVYSNVAAIGVYSPSEGARISGNHILRGADGYSVWALSSYTGPPTDLDFTNNYWGTTDPEEVAAGILDGNDDSDIRMFVIFEPMADGPVGTETMSFGGVKALFR